MYILLAVEHAKDRAVLRRLLVQEPELSVVGEATEAQDLLAQTQSVQPDLVLLDWELPGLRGTPLLQLLRCPGCSLKVIAYSERTAARQEALNAGADGFFDKKEPLEELVTIVRAVGGLSPYFVG